MDGASVSFPQVVPPVLESEEGDSYRQVLANEARGRENLSAFFRRRKALMLRMHALCARSCDFRKFGKNRRWHWFSSEQKQSRDGGSTTAAAVHRLSSTTRGDRHVLVLGWFGRLVSRSGTSIARLAPVNDCAKLLCMPRSTVQGKKARSSSWQALSGTTAVEWIRWQLFSAALCWAKW